MKFWLFLFAGSTVALLASCTTTVLTDESDDSRKRTSGSLSQLVADTYTDGFSSSYDGYVPPGLVNNSFSGSTNSKEIEEKAAQDLLSMKADENIIFTDPDNPYAEIEELDKAFEMKNERAKQWQQSFWSAMRDARRAGKPVLIWFHDSRFSPASTRLASELLQTDKFEDWARDNIIRIRYDKSAEYKTPQDNQARGIYGDLASRKREYVQKAFEHYNVRGTPHLVILTASGKQVSSWNGYSGGNANHVMARIQKDVDIANKQFSEFKERLRDAHYRDWIGKNGTVLFAQFLRYDPKKKIVWLKEFDGTQFSTSFKSLSAKDQEYVQSQLTKKAF